jgi:hypothetical protein
MKIKFCYKPNEMTYSPPEGFTFWHIDYRFDPVQWLLTRVFGDYKEIIKTDAVITYQEFFGYKIYKEVRYLQINGSLLIYAFSGKSRTASLLRRRI